MRLSAAAALLAAASLAGCGGSTLSRTDVANNAKTQLEQKVGAKARSVVCPRDLDAKVGASERCTLTAMDGSTVGLTITVDRVSGSTAHYTVVADQHVASGPKAP